MKILVDKSFERDSKRLSINIQIQLKDAIQRIADAASVQQLDVVKIQGTENAFRYRFGNYRIGFYLDKDVVILSRVLDRKEIYQYFPRK